MASSLFWPKLDEADYRFTLWIISIIIAYILGSIQLYGIYRFNKIKNLAIIQKRYPLIILIESVFTLTYLLIAFPGVSYCIFYQAHFKSASLHLLFTYCGYAVYPFTGHGIVITEFARLWLISFDLHYLNSTSNEIWKSKINPKQYSTKNNFYLQNSHKFGNQKWILQRFAIFYLIVASISCACFLYSFYTNFNRQIIQLIDGALYFISGFSIIYLWWKSPKNLNEQFLFQYEFKITTLLMVGANVIYCLNQGLTFIDPYFATFMTVFVAGLSFCMVSLLSTLYIPWKIMKLANWYGINNEESVYPESSETDLASLQLYHVSSSRKSKIQQGKKQELSMREKLFMLFAGGESGDSNDIDLFISHINQEFSLEIMLSFIEFVQFRQFLKEIAIKYNYVDSEQIGGVESFRFSSTVPKSSIVYDHKGIPCEDRDELVKFFKEIAYELYEKYIVVGTEFEINISYQLRQWFWKRMNNKTMWLNLTFDGGDHGGLVQLIHIFDAAIDEMLYLQIQSFVRFNTQI